MSSLTSPIPDSKQFALGSPKSPLKTLDIIKNAKGDSYEGNLSNGQRSGHGIMIYGNGDIYIGKWENDLFSGLGQ